MRVKICGVTRAEDAERASHLGAWAVGLMFVPSSPRLLTLEAAKRLRSAIGPDTLAIGVFADADDELIRRAVAACKLDAVQLHGSETPEACAAAGAPAYKALPFAGPQDVARLEAYAGRAAGLVLETVRRMPGGRERVAPEEQARRWKLARGCAGLGTLLLAGELTPGNVADAIRAARPAGVDVSGGVESSPGIKDPRKLEAFFEAVGRTEVE